MRKSQTLLGTRQKAFLFVFAVLLIFAPIKSNVTYHKPVIAVVAIRALDQAQEIANILNQYGANASVVNNNAYDVADYDALVLPGGSDIDPSLYGQANTSSFNINAKEDKLQINAVKRFSAAKKPVLGICRGSQIINVAFGGTLRQQIDGHMQIMRRVATRKRSTFWPVLGTYYNGMHYHHQCVEQLGDGLIQTETDVFDSCIEGFQHQSLPVYGFQWHPEMTNRTRRAVFRFFVHICEVRENT